MTTTQAQHVLVTTRGRLGHIRLNRPAKINALTVAMITQVRSALDRFSSDESVQAVLIDGAGERGLCAGGDIAAVYDGLTSAAAGPEAFWGDEYRMNLEIAQYPKPVVALMDGIVFGGGLGISGHASVRVVTETSQVAMPETAIGLSPDVGGLYLLARAPGELGTHAALTGARFGPADAIAAGLADHFVPRANLARLVERLAVPGGWTGSDGGDGAVRPGDPAAAPNISSQAGDDAGVLHAVAGAVTALSESPPPGRWPTDRPWIDACYAGDDAREMLHRLRSRSEGAAARAAEVLAGMSPTAVAVTLRAVRNAATMTLAQVLEQDLMLCTRFMDHPDFAEGIRARIIDKDRHPRWRPSSLKEVTAADVDAFFVPLG